MAYRSNRFLTEYATECSATVLRRGSQGSALLLVLFAIILLTGLITATGISCGGTIISATVTTNNHGSRTSNGAIVTGNMQANVICPTAQ